MHFDGLKHEEDLRKIQSPKIALAKLLWHRLVDNLVEFDVFLHGCCRGGVVFLKFPCLRLDNVRRVANCDKFVDGHSCGRERCAFFGITVSNNACGLAHPPDNPRTAVRAIWRFSSGISSQSGGHTEIASPDNMAPIRERNGTSVRRSRNEFVNELS